MLAHVIRSQSGFLAEHGVDATTSADLDTDRSADPAGAWRAHEGRMREVLADPAVAGMEYDGVFGRTTVGASIVAFHGFDLVVHRWDIAVAAGLDERLTDEELDMLDRSADGFAGDHLHHDGIRKPALPAAEGAGRQERVLARLGRRTPAGS